MDSDYVHGYSERESERLYDQASALVDLLHCDARYPVGSPISDTIVTLENGQTTATDKNGGFTTTASGGNHVLTIQVEGFTDKKFNITIAPGVITNLR